MYFAPIGVGAAMAFTVGPDGARRPGEPGQAAAYVVTVRLAAFGLLVLLPVALLFRVPVRRFLAAVAEPATIAFATSTSEAALPRAMEAMEALGVPRRIVAFVIPAGYSFNLDGSRYTSPSAASSSPRPQACISRSASNCDDGDADVNQQGVAGVPRATLVVLLATAATFHLPTEPIFVILGIDALNDMARTMVQRCGQLPCQCRRGQVGGSVRRGTRLAGRSPGHGRLGSFTDAVVG